MQYFMTNYETVNLDISSKCYLIIILQPTLTRNSVYLIKGMLQRNMTNTHLIQKISVGKRAT